MAVEQVRAVERDGGVRRNRSVKVGDVGNVTRVLREGYVSVYWPTRFVSTVESRKDLEPVRA